MIHAVAEVAERPPGLAAMIQNLERSAGRRTLLWPRRKPTGLLLITAAGVRHEDPPWSLVAQVLDSLEPNENRFCILDDQRGSYIQTLCGVNGFHLERHEPATPDNVNFRAGYPGGSREPQLLHTFEFTNDGQSRDLLQLDDVVEAFNAYYDGSNRSWLDWREYRWE